tara:strand:+ start:595 stop:702 length:108 start_codon:yes stop_codon:yes gene_type:complete
MSDRLFEFVVTGIFVAVIAIGSILGAWALLATMSW